jgi:PKD repeat protein
MILTRWKEIHSFVSNPLAMKKIVVFCFLVAVGTEELFAQYCDGVGNVMIFANYDGGVLNIIIDQNVPNIKIGVCTYKATTINITGPFAANVTEVRYAGLDSFNDHCAQVISATSINAPVGAATSILFAPAATLSDPDGNQSMICAYSCASGGQGGCNTASQVVDYFMDQFNGDLRFYYSQYGCWPSNSLGMSPGGDCCPTTNPAAPVASFTMSADVICAGECIDLLDLSSNLPTSWQWSFPGASVSSSENQDPIDICYENAGSYTITLIAANAFGIGSTSMNIEVQGCGIPGCTYPQALNYNPNATIDDQSCTFDCNNDCPGDLNNDGFIGVADLLMFIPTYGLLCD